MPSGNLTLLDIAARTGSDAVVGLIEDATIAAPEFAVSRLAPCRAPLTASLDAPRCLRRSSATSTKVLLLANPNTSRKSKEMFFVDSQLEVDEAIVKGDPRDIGDVLADEGFRRTGIHFPALGITVLLWSHC